MTLPLIVRRSLRQHLLSTIITALSIALAGGLLISVWVIKEESQATFTGVNIGFDAVLGARGSKLQLVLNSIFHLEASPGNLSQADYLYVKGHPAVKLAIPIAVGDNLRGFRIVGTIPEFFTGVEYAPDKRFAFLPGGRMFDPDAKEAIVGSFAASQLGLKVGNVFHPFHGLAYNPKEQHADVYTVAAILAPSNTPADKVVWIPLHGLQTMSGHDPGTATDVSAVLIQLRSPTAGFRLDMMYNRQGTRLTFAYPIGAIVADLFSKIGWFDQVLALVAYLVALVSAAGVLVAIYNSMASRRRDIAILRSLGARRRTVFSAVVLEAAAIGLIGMAGSFAVYLAVASGVAAVIRAQTGVVLTPWTFDPVMIWAPLAMIGLCATGGIVPAWSHTRPTSPQPSLLHPRSRRFNMKTSRTGLLFIGLSLWAACGKHSAAPPTKEQTALHRDVPPHGGTPVALGDDYKLELVFDGESGVLSAYVLDDEMEEFMRSSSPSLTISVNAGGQPSNLVLNAVANIATGETVGDTALFQGRAPGLTSLGSFDGTLQAIVIRGTKFSGIRFKFPHSNESN